MEVKYGLGRKHSEICNKICCKALCNEVLHYSAILFFLVLPLISFSKVIEIGKGHQYSSIQSALLKCASGDSLLVYSGVYAEGELIINKRISLIGIGKPVLDGLKKDFVITVKAS